MAKEYRIKSEIPFTMASLTLLSRSLNIADLTFLLQMFHYMMNWALCIKGYLPISLFVSIVSNTYHEIILRCNVFCLIFFL